MPEVTNPTTAAHTVMTRCDALARHTEQPGQITRRYGTPALAAMMDEVAGWMTAAGLTTRRDAIGNLIGRREGTDPAAGTLVLGSHLDSVIDGGRYDGPLGVLVALAAAAAAPPLPFALEVTAFADEEGARFRTAYLGSLAYAGKFDPALLDRPDETGAPMRDAVSVFGGDPTALTNHRSAPDRVLGYLEVHIEQGPVLESRDLPVGVVTAISGRTLVRATFTGEAGHAGTVPMINRRDALTAGAELVLVAERAARASANLLATAGEFRIQPGASNVIPGQAVLSLDIRSPVDEVRQRAATDLKMAATDITGRRRVDLDWAVMQEAPATPCDPTLQAWFGEAIRELGYDIAALPSGAGHDAVVMATICPAAMLFVRCKDGISHNPAESVTESDVAVAIEVMSRVLVRAGREWSA